MRFEIDGRPLIREPHTIEVAPYEDARSFTADQRPLVAPGSPYMTVNCTWGRNLTHEDVFDELRSLRANVGVHAITFEPRRKGPVITINAYMGQPREAHVGYTVKCAIASSAVTIPFIQVDLPQYLLPLELNLRGIIAVASPFAHHTAPVAGTIIMVDGYIEDVGAGAGQTRVQIRNADRAINYLTTEGDFMTTVPLNRRLQNHVLATDLDFYAGDQIGANVTTIPAGGMSRDANITLWCLAFNP